MSDRQKIVFVIIAVLVMIGGRVGFDAWKKNQRCDDYHQVVQMVADKIQANMASNPLPQVGDTWTRDQIEAAIRSNGFESGVTPAGCY